MFVLIILAVIIFALVKRRRYRYQLDGERWTRKWERWHDRSDHKYAKWSRKWQKWERRARDFAREAPELERKFREKLAAAAMPPSATQRQSDEQRARYERAHRRAAQEAGFYMHLFWYGIVIGFLFILNMIASPHYQWWFFPAIGWGIGLTSHFAAVYGWRWIHDRVFESVIRREVQREVNLEKEAMRTENQASLNELAATFAHEIRNPIAAARSLVQQMGEDPVSSENVEYAKVALDELARVERSVSHLLKYAKEEDYDFANVNLAAVLDTALTQMRGKLEARHISVSRNYIGGPTIRADSDRLRQVFSNVIDNAIDAMEGNAGEGRLELEIRNTGGRAAVVIRDNGCGIPEDKLGKIFNPFYTTKRDGTGLGMGVARKVMEAHRGGIEVQSTVGVGTQFTLSLPPADAARGWSKSPESAGAESQTSAFGSGPAASDGGAPPELRQAGGRR